MEGLQLKSQQDIYLHIVMIAMSNITKINLIQLLRIGTDGLVQILRINVINEAYPSLFSFNRADLAYKFHKNFKDLLKEASPLLF